MLLYVTGDMYRERKPRPLFTIPDTVNGLYDIGMREHDRPAVLHYAADGVAWMDMPDWRFDRLAVRVAAYCMERLKLTGGERVAVFGRVHPLWLIAEFAALGLPGTVIGVEHDVADDALVAALNSAEVRLAFATDRASAARLVAVGERTPRLEHIVTLDDAVDHPSVIPLSKLLDLANTLDTAERARRWREGARQVTPADPAIWHVSARPLGTNGDASTVTELTQGEGMARARAQIERAPAKHGDAAYFEGERVTLVNRILWYAYAGNGYTTIMLGAPGKTAEELRAIRPTTLVASAGFLQQLRDAVDQRPSGAIARVPGLGRLGAGARERRLQRTAAEFTGGRLRSIEPNEPIDHDLALVLERIVPRAVTGVVGEVTLGSARLRAEVR